MVSGSSRYAIRHPLRMAILMSMEVEKLLLRRLRPYLESYLRCKPAREVEEILPKEASAANDAGHCFFRQPSRHALEIAVRAHRSYLQHHYHLFEILKPYLQRRPASVGEQLSIPMSKEVQQHLIEQFYSFDPIVLREVLGKTVNARLRKGASYCSANPF